jgi:FHA domain-containing protein
MNVLKSVETTIANLLEGAFGRMFRSEVRPVELARKLTREMDEHRTESLSRTYAPNEFAVWLSPADRARYEEVEDDVIDELCAYLLEHARREQLILSSPPHISFHTDERLALGEFGIQAKLVRHGPPRERPRAADGPPETAAERGETMIYSTSARVGGPVQEAHARRPPPRATLAIGPRRLLVPAAGAIVGRSRDCDVVLDDAGVSRRHAEIRPAADGWTIMDLDSTNGILLNGREVHSSQPLQAGDRIALGSTEIVFEVR